MKLKNQGKGLGGLLLLSVFLAPGVQAKGAHKEEVKAEAAQWGLIVNKAMLHNNDGYSKETYFVDNYNQSTRAWITGEKKLDNCFKVGAKLEIQFLQASSILAGQTDRDDSASDDRMGVRQADAWLAGDFGKISLGHGSMSGFTAIANDLSGTSDTIRYAGPWLMGSQIQFHPTGTGQVTSSPTIINIFSPYELIFARQSRLRYDTPTFAGFTLSGSIYSGSISGVGALDGTAVATPRSGQKYGTDLTLRYADNFEGVKLLGAVTFNRLSKGNGSGGTMRDDVQNAKIWDGSFSVLHVDTGLNATVNYAQKTLANPGNVVPGYTFPTNKPTFGSVALGLISNLNSYGTTNFIVDYTQTKNSYENDGKGKEFGVGVVQKLNKVNSEVYVALRRLKYNPPSTSSVTSYDKIFQAFAGVRVSLGGKLPT